MNLSWWQVKCLYLCVFFGCTLSSYALENFGISYTSEGGNPLLKIHIYTYILIILFTSIALKYGVKNLLRPLGRIRYAWLFMSFSVLWLIVYGLYRNGMSGMAYTLDTLLAPLLCMPLAARLSLKQCIGLLKLLSILLLANSCIALIEFFLKQRIWDVEFSSFGNFFRSTALMGHPLNNALILCSLALMLSRYSRFGMAFYLIISGLALFAFGARAATAIFFFTTFITSLWIAKNTRLKNSQGNKIKIALIPLLAIAVFGISSALFINTSIFDRIVSNLFVDASAMTRIDVWSIIDVMSQEEILLGASSDLAMNFSDVIGVGVIENYLIGWVFSFGIVGCGLLIISFLILLFRIFTLSDLYGKISIASFFVASLGNNSLSSKTPALFLILIAATLLIRIKSLSNQSTQKNDIEYNKLQLSNNWGLTSSTQIKASPLAKIRQS
ncbi:VpsF family polysaccharide biosynthesis protein [Pseudomonas fluorescens]|nr:VpsF family polysaccharide biosynthesis protein [Pseudomonas fluorescens]